MVFRRILFRFSRVFCCKIKCNQTLAMWPFSPFVVVTLERGTGNKHIYNMLSSLYAFAVQPMCFSHSKKLNRAEMRVQLFFTLCIHFIAFLYFIALKLRHFIHIHAWYSSRAASVSDGMAKSVYKTQALFFTPANRFFSPYLIVRVYFIKYKFIHFSFSIFIFTHFSA